MSMKRYVAIVNPHGGTRQGLAVLSQAESVFAASGISLDVRVTTHPGHAKQLAQMMDFEGIGGICVIGGDGTIHEVVGGLMQRKDGDVIPLGVIPGGTGNSVSQHLNCTDPARAVDRIAAGGTRPLDVVRVSMADGVAHCINIVGWGAVVDINRMAERLRWLGPPRYSLAALLQIACARRRRVKLVLDDQVVEDDLFLAAVCNTKFTGKGMQLAPRAEIGDGKLDVIFVRRASRWQMLQLLRKVFDGSHVSLEFVEYRQVSSVRIEPVEIDGLNLDGELAGTTPLHAEILPAALRIFA